MANINRQIAQELGVREEQISATVELLDGGATVPFVARYRKEITGGLDDAQLRTLEERLTYLRELEERRVAILNSVRERGKLDAALEAAIMAADSKGRLEDIYLPFKPKRRTKAEIAREAGLEPLAEKLLRGLEAGQKAGGDRRGRVSARRSREMIHPAAATLSFRQRLPGPANSSARALVPARSQRRPLDRSCGERASFEPRLKPSDVCAQVLGSPLARDLLAPGPDGGGGGGGAARRERPRSPASHRLPAGPRRRLATGERR